MLSSFFCVGTSDQMSVDEPFWSHCWTLWYLASALSSLCGYEGENCSQVRGDLRQVPDSEKTRRGGIYYDCISCLTICLGGCWFQASCDWNRSPCIIGVVILVTPHGDCRTGKWNADHIGRGTCGGYTIMTISVEVIRYYKRAIFPAKRQFLLCKLTCVTPLRYHN